ncbi:HupE/UreJ family protein [bacterium]|nr:HupE/UreJ family protein [bacterium]
MSRSFMLRILKVNLTLSLLMVSTVSSRGHELFTSYSIIEIQDKELICSFKFDQTDLAMIFDLDEDGDGEVSKDELQLNVEQMQSYVYENVAVTVSREVLDLRRRGETIFEDDLGNVFVQFDFANTLVHQPWKLTLGLRFWGELGPRHKNLAKIIHNGEVQQAILTVGNPEQSFSFTGEDVSVTSQVLQFTWLGMEHIFIGYDHILFLLGLIVLGGSFKNLVKIVTAFTVAHSITLILAALEVVTIPGRLVESVIALSIVYIAVENFIVKNTDDRWLITFVFGLMHGFGFAGVLTELGLPTKGLVASLLSFNVGVEIGQLAIVALTFPIVVALSNSRWRKQFVYGLSSLILIFGVLWFIERAFALDLPLV